MNKKELISSVAAKGGLTGVQAAAAVDAFINTVIETLKDGQEVRIPGFGSFEVSHRPASKGINPSTREPIEIPARNVAKFKPGTLLKEAANSQ